MKTKILLISTFLLFSIFFIFSQEDTELKMEASNFGFYFGPQITFSTAVSRNTQRVGVSTAAGMEYKFKVIKNMAITPSLDLSMLTYGLYSTGRAYICEPENRAAEVFHFLLDLPVLYSLEVKNWTIDMGGGIAFLLRGAVLSYGVKANSLNAYGITAQEEVKGINSFFWKSGRFFYPSLKFKTGYVFKTGWEAGVHLKLFLPIFNLFDKAKPQFSDGMIFQIGVVIHPAKRKK